MSSSFIDKLAGIFIKERCFLVARSYGKTHFYLPGGKREPGESDKEALIREIQEELGFSLHPDSLNYDGVFRAQADGKQHGVDVQLTCYRVETKQEPVASAEIEEIIWINSQNRCLCSTAAQQVLDWLKEQDLID